MMARKSTGAREFVVAVALTEAERDRLYEAARLRGVSVSTLTYAALFEHTIGFDDFSRVYTEPFITSGRNRGKSGHNGGE